MLRDERLRVTKWLCPGCNTDNHPPQAERPVHIHFWAFSAKCLADIAVFRLLVSKLNLYAPVNQARNQCGLLILFMRRLARPEPIKDWSMATRREKLIKIGAKVVAHVRCLAFQMAEVAIS